MQENVSSKQYRERHMLTPFRIGFIYGAGYHCRHP